MYVYSFCVYILSTIKGAKMKTYELIEKMKSSNVSDTDEDDYSPVDDGSWVGR